MGGQKHPVRRLSGQVVAALAFLATVPGSFIMAFAPEHRNYLWLFLPISIVWALLWVYGGPAIRAVRRINFQVRNYERLEGERERALEVAGQKIVETERLARELTERKVQESTVEMRGILEGRRRAIGEVFGAASGARLRPAAMEVQGNILRFAAFHDEGSPPPVGSRFLLGTDFFRSVAVLSVVEYQPTQKGVLLVVVQEVDSDSVMGLMAQARSGNGDPPKTLRIYPRTTESPEAYMSEDGE